MRILSLSGFIPEEICDVVRFTQYSGERNIPYYCGYVSDYISQVLNDPTIDGAVYPKSCDSTRIMSSYLGASDKFLFQFGIPPYGSLGGEEFFASELRAFKNAIEKYYGITIHDIEDRINIINDRNKAVHKTYENLRDVSYSEYLERIHMMLLRPLHEQKWEDCRASRSGDGKNVYVIGSFLSNLSIVKQIERVGLNVVGDNLPESGRLVSSIPINPCQDLFMEIAKSKLSARLSPTQNSFKAIVDNDYKEIIEKNVKGIIYITQKYCEPYEFLYGTYKKMADEVGIPIVRLVVDNTEADARSALVLGAFSDLL